MDIEEIKRDGQLRFLENARKAEVFKAQETLRSVASNDRFDSFTTVVDQVNVMLANAITLHTEIKRLEAL